MRLHAPYLETCFGRGDAAKQAACRCPPATRDLCLRTRLDPKRSPRHERGRGGRRSYTPLPNDLFCPWCPPGRSEPSDAVKNTYYFLVTRTLATRRWVVDSTDELARRRGVAVKTFRKHCVALKKLDLIVTVPFRLLSHEHNANDHAIWVPDLPRWYRIPERVVDDETITRPCRAIDRDKVSAQLVELRRRRGDDAA